MYICLKKRVCFVIPLFYKILWKHIKKIILIIRSKQRTVVRASKVGHLYFLGECVYAVASDSLMSKRSKREVS